MTMNEDVKIHPNFK